MLRSQRLNLKPQYAEIVKHNSVNEVDKAKHRRYVPFFFFFFEKPLQSGGSVSGKTNRIYCKNIMDILLSIIAKYMCSTTRRAYQMDNVINNLESRRIVTQEFNF